MIKPLFLQTSWVLLALVPHLLPTTQATNTLYNVDDLNTADPLLSAQVRRIH